MSNKNTIQWSRVGDYLIPNLILPPEEASITLGKCGMIRKHYLEKHTFNSLLMQVKLHKHCFEIENKAMYMFDMLVEQMEGSEGVTEELKEHNQWEREQKISNIKARAKDVVKNNLIYT